MFGTSHTDVIRKSFFLSLRETANDGGIGSTRRESVSGSVFWHIVTSNHIHLLVRDRGEGKIAKSMQLIAGRAAQEHNQRKSRNGAFWEDRYHAAAVDTEGYLSRCMVYIDLNRVRTDVVKHPSKWLMSGYHEIQNPSTRYTVIEQPALLELFEIRKIEQHTNSMPRLG